MKITEFLVPCFIRIPDKMGHWRYCNAVFWAICTNLSPNVPIPDSPELHAAIERSLQSQDETEKLAAVYLGILNHQLSEREVRFCLGTFPSYLRSRRFLRELAYVDNFGRILDENGNITNEYDPGWLQGQTPHTSPTEYTKSE